MLQAFLDDSAMGQWPASVISGFIAPAEKWAAFADEWQEALDMRPSIRYFKMSEAEACTGEFAYWSPGRRDERIALLFSIIERHVEVGIVSSVFMDEYREVFHGRVPEEFRYWEHPYFLLFFGVVNSIAIHYGQLSHVDPIDFIFDNQPDQAKRIMESWDDLRQLTNNDAIRPLVTKPPIFRDDKMTLPLQAADLHAWWFRRGLETALIGRPERQVPFPHGKAALDVPILTMFWDKRRLKRMRRALTPYYTTGPMKITARFQV